METESLVIRHARIVDPSRDLDLVGDILIGSGEILATGKLGLDRTPEGAKVVDGTGLVVAPGFIDLHCHLREPGFEYKETIAAGSKAGAKGGFTTLCAMPNTDPPIDNAAVVEFIQQKAHQDSLVRILPIGCVTKGRKGHELSEMEELASAGVACFSDDGDPVFDANLMKLALTYSSDLSLAISNHCQEKSLSCNGVMAEGPVATHLGLDGIPAAAEEAMIARDIALAEATGGRLHVAHLSTAGSVPLVREAKERGLSVTAEVCPHHLTVTDQWVLGGKGAATTESGGLAYDTSTKVYPPLRSQRDVEALIVGLADGVIDCIATDHAPHDLTSKQVTYQDASFGISVLETALGSLMQLVHSSKLGMADMIDRLTLGPAKVLGESYTDLGTLQPGTTADIVIFDPDQEWTVDTSEFESKGRNTPLEGTTLKGRVVATIVGGNIIYEGPGLKFQEVRGRA